MLEAIESGRAEATVEEEHARPLAPRPPASSLRPIPFAATLTAAAALAACGGGGGGGSGGVALGSTTPTSTVDANSNTGATSTPTVAAGSLTPLGTTAAAQSYAYTTPKSPDEAARFLLQAQFSASDADIAAVTAQGYLPWLGAQSDLPQTQTGWAWIAGKTYGTVVVDDMIWNQLMTSTDGFRKRAALALTEIFVVSADNIGSNWPDLMMAQYWDTMVAGVTGTFRQLLENVTLNPAMGYFLNTKGNQQANSQGREPDENYAREVMQLMTIGLYMLNPDGTPINGSDGNPQPTFAQSDVSNLASVFTGYDLDITDNERNSFTPPGATYTIESNAWTQRPMALNPVYHSRTAATFLGVTVPANASGPDSLKTALDTLANHPNVGPFIGKQLIQRLVTSNPSAAYVARISSVFANNGAGVRGDMKSVFAAILLDNEARSPAGLTDATYGRLREPMLRYAQWARTFGGTSTSTNWKIGDLSSTTYGLGQSPLRSPSVFNFFAPGYVPPSTAIASAKLVAPEFQLVDETTVGGYLNFIQGQLPINTKDVNGTYANELALVLDPVSLVARLNLMLTGNQLSADVVSVITTALNTPAVTATSTTAVKMNRVYAAILMVLAAPSYLIQK